jgi:hypothetical protein
MNAVVIHFSKKIKRDAASVSEVPRPMRDDSPVTITITGSTAASIRHAALWAGKQPEQFILDWLGAGFPSSEQPA